MLEGWAWWGDLIWRGVAAVCLARFGLALIAVVRAVLDGIREQQRQDPDA